MQVWSLVTRKSSLSPIAWAGLYYVESIHADGYIAGKCVCLYSDENANVLYPLYELYNVGKRTGQQVSTSSTGTSRRTGRSCQTMVKSSRLSPR